MWSATDLEVAVANGKKNRVGWEKIGKIWYLIYAFWVYVVGKLWEMIIYGLLIPIIISPKILDTIYKKPSTFLHIFACWMWRYTMHLVM